MANPLTNFENVLNEIQKKYISLPPHEERRNNDILIKIVNRILNEMKSDGLFARYYNRIFYGGSYFDGLRVGKPEEFDLDFLLKVPKEGEPNLSPHTNEPGFLTLQFTAPDKLSDEFKKKMLDEKNFLSSTKVNQWMEGVFTKALNKFLVNGTYHFEGDNYHLTGRKSKSGPAMTLILTGPDYKIDVDLVPCFEFPEEKWPVGGYKKNPVPKKSTFFIVPKSPKIENHSERYWRLSFQEQERELLNGKGTLKPTLKLFKRLRDVQQHRSVASYYIKTVFLWEDEKTGGQCWKGTMTDTFLKMLDAYVEYIDSGKIPYFWNKKNNLLNVTEITHSNMKNRLKYIQKDIKEKYKTDPHIICKYLDAQIERPVCRTPPPSLLNPQNNYNDFDFEYATSNVDLQMQRSSTSPNFNNANRLYSTSTTYSSPSVHEVHTDTINRKRSEESENTGLSPWATAGIVTLGIGAIAADIGAWLYSSKDDENEDGRDGDRKSVRK